MRLLLAASLLCSVGALAHEAVYERVLKTKFCQLRTQQLSGFSPVVSFIGQNPKLIRLADELKRDKAVQSEADHLLERFHKGNPSPGIGSRQYGGGIIELRGAKGSRVFVKKVEGVVFVLGKCDKRISGDQEKLIRILRSQYPEMSKESGGFTGERGSGN